MVCNRDLQKIKEDINDIEKRLNTIIDVLASSQTLCVGNSDGKCVMEPTHGQNFRQQGPITHFPSENPIVCTGHKSSS
ncbi:hypothetical protein AB205_0117300 [Aquarana catesbeiana]|uniref:Uncharacterized protein n=1 Tax=Aquarana catesbeiana TaxID=8400 RepID=A0A2G9QGP0_AQUCT|nr:hypothetical protein AB205_0117300 [Aquarana catesbeiana]